jgi:hypothetical protein
MRFSILWLLALVAAASVICMMLFALPDGAAFCSLLFTTLAVPSLAIPVIVYSRGNVRAFAIGVVSSFGLTPFAFWFLPYAVIIGGPQQVFDNLWQGTPEELRAWKMFFAAVLGSTFLLGLAAVVIRHLCHKSRRTNSTANNEWPQPSHLRIGAQQQAES